MNKFKIALLCIFLFTLTACLTACGQQIELDYNIDFNVDGKIVHTVGTDGTKIKMPANPSKENYTFEGWYWKENGKGDRFTLNSLLDQPLSESNHYTVYAYFKGVDVPVTLDDGTVVTITYDANYYIKPKSTENERFDGWQTLDGRMLTDASGNSVGKCDFLSATVKPMYREGRKTVIFDANGGSFNPAEKITNYCWDVGDVNRYLDLNTPQKTDYIFLGWTTTVGGEVLESADGLTLTDEMTFYAKWMYKCVKITFEPGEIDGLIPAGKMSDREYSSFDEFVICDYFLENYEFIGWQCGDEFFAAREKHELEYAEYTFVACWKPVKVMISFVPTSDTTTEGISGEMNKIVGNEGSYLLPSCGFSRSGYTFEYWSLNGERYNAGQSVELKNGKYEFVAIWKERTTLSIRFVVDSSMEDYIDGEMQQFNAEAGTITLPELGFVGVVYKFDCWECDGQKYADKATIDLPAGDYVFTAKWLPCNFTIKFYPGTAHATGSVEDIETFTGNPITLPKCTFVFEGYEFVGWCWNYMPDESEWESLFASGQMCKEGKRLAWNGSEGSVIEYFAVWKKI